MLLLIVFYLAQSVPIIYWFICKENKAFSCQHALCKRKRSSDIRFIVKNSVGLTVTFWTHFQQQTYHRFRSLGLRTSLNLFFVCLFYFFFFLGLWLLKLFHLSYLLFKREKTEYSRVTTVGLDPKCSQGWSRGKLKPSNQSPILVSYIYDRCMITWSITCYLLGSHCQKARIRTQACNMERKHPRKHFSPKAKKLIPLYFLKICLVFIWKAQ